MSASVDTAGAGGMAKTQATFSAFLGLDTPHPDVLSTIIKQDPATPPTTQHNKPANPDTAPAPISLAAAASPASSTSSIASREDSTAKRSARKRKAPATLDPSSSSSSSGDDAAGRTEKNALAVKRQRRRAANRQAAQASRNRKKVYVESLEAKIKALEEMNAALSTDVARLQGENHKLKHQVQVVPSTMPPTYSSHTVTTTNHHHHHHHHNGPTLNNLFGGAAAACAATSSDNEAPLLLSQGELLARGVADEDQRPLDYANVFSPMRPETLSTSPPSPGHQLPLSQQSLIFLVTLLVSLISSWPELIPHCRSRGGPAGLVSSSKGTMPARSMPPRRVSRTNSRTLMLKTSSRSGTPRQELTSPAFSTAPTIFSPQEPPCSDLPINVGVRRRVMTALDQTLREHAAGLGPPAANAMLQRLATQVATVWERQQRRKSGMPDLPEGGTPRQDVVQLVCAVLQHLQ